MKDLKEKIISEIKKIYDPEIPVNIFELGLIYKIDVNEDEKIDFLREVFYRNENFMNYFSV